MVSSPMTLETIVTSSSESVMFRREEIIRVAGVHGATTANAVGRPPIDAASTRTDTSGTSGNGPSHAVRRSASPRGRHCGITSWNDAIGSAAASNNGCQSSAPSLMNWITGLPTAALSARPQR